MHTGASAGLTMAGSLFLMAGSVGTLSAQKPNPTVTGVTVAADQPNYTGKCPVKLTFTGTILTSAFTGPKRTVTYEWIRSDTKAPGAKHTVSVTASSSTNVSIAWTLGAAGKTANVSETLKLLSPTGITSTPAKVTLTCTP
jgi:hypothetical protein